MLSSYFDRTLGRKSEDITGSFTGFPIGRCRRNRLLKDLNRKTLPCDSLYVSIHISIHCIHQAPTLTWCVLAWLCVSTSWIIWMLKLSISLHPILIHILSPIKNNKHPQTSRDLKPREHFRTLQLDTCTIHCNFQWTINVSHVWQSQSSVPKNGFKLIICSSTCCKYHSFKSGHLVFSASSAHKMHFFEDRWSV